MKQNYHKLRLDCLVILGGNGTQKTANLLREEGLNIIHLPKTIDNDIYGNRYLTLGFFYNVQSTWRVQPLIVYTQQQHPIIVSLS